MARKDTAHTGTPATKALVAAGVTHVVVHGGGFEPSPDSVDGLSLIARKDEIALYRLSGP